MEKKIIYTAIFVDENQLREKFEQTHPNSFYSHSTIEFRPKDINNFPVGKEVSLKIKGRIKNDNVDAILVDNPLSKNEHPHITLSTAEGVKPFQSNSEIKNNIGDVIPLDDYIPGVYGYFNGEEHVTTKDVVEDNIHLLQEQFKRIYKY